MGKQAKKNIPILESRKSCYKSFTIFALTMIITLGISFPNHLFRIKLYKDFYQVKGWLVYCAVHLKLFPVFEFSYQQALSCSPRNSDIQALFSAPKRSICFH